jgi:hypothetical protein
MLQNALKMRIVEKRRNKLSSKSDDTRSAQHVEVLIDRMVTIMERLDHDSRVFQKNEVCKLVCKPAKAYFDQDVFLQ